MNRFRKALCVALVLLLLVASVPAVPVADLGFGITASALNATGKCGKTATYTFDSATGELVISGTGVLAAEAFHQNQEIKDVVINYGITEIGTDAFRDSSVINVDISDSVTVINDSAFGYCHKLEKVSIPDSVTIIDDKAFIACYNLTNVNIPNGVTTIGSYAFCDCNSLTNIDIPNSVTTIGNDAFCNCNSVTSVDIPDSVTTIGWGSFYGCSSLEYVTVPKSVRYIGGQAFRYCPSLTDVYYEGAEENWNAIQIDENNTGLENAEIHFAETHTHTWDVEETIDYATCTKPGKKIVRCKGAVCKKYEELPMKEHECYRYNVKDVTCTEKGYIEYHCHYCDYSYTEDIEAKGHSYYEKYIEPTCTKNGYTYYYCDNCGDSYTDKEEQAKGHTPDETGNNCVICGEYLGCVHTYSGEKLITKTPTCTEKGQKAIVCSKCKANKPGSEEEIDALGHAWNEGEIIKDATCSEKGSKKFKCNNKCGETKTEEIAVKPHNYKEVITHATCTEAGYSTFTCTMCGSHYVDKPLAPYGHDYVNGKCTRCGDYEYGCNHIWGVWVITVDATCTMTGIRERKCTRAGCGEIEKEVLAMKDHYFEEKITHATCTEDGYSTFTCTMCGSHYVDNVVKAYGHMFDTYFHDEGSATCYKDGTRTSECANGCGTKNTIADPGSKTDHEMTDFAVIKAATCTEDGEEEAKCFYFDKCGYSEIVPVDALGHDESGKFVETKAATCTEKGEKQKTCTRCPEIVATEEIPALGHNYINNICTRCGAVNGNPTPDTGDHTYPDQWSVIIPATCKETGVAVKVCFDCHEVIAMVVPKAGHSDFDGDSKCDSCGGTITVVEPEKPAEKPEEKPCNCDCHAGGIKAFFFKLINFFAKIFDKNARVCDCGKAH